MCESVAKSYSRRVAILAIITFGVAFVFVSLGSFMLVGDEAYQALCVRDYLQCPMAMFAFWMGNVWTTVFGDNLMGLRALMALCYLASISAGCAVLYHRTKAGMFTAMVFMAMCAATPFSTLFIYGWDAGAYPWMTLFTITLLWYMTRPSLPRIAALGASCAVMVLSRVPTLAALPVTLVFVIAVRREGGRISWRHVAADYAIGLFAFAITGFIAVLLITDAHPMLYLDAWNPDNIINGHFDGARIAYRFKQSVQSVICAYAPMLLCLSGAVFMLRVKRRRMAWLCVVAAAVVALSVLTIRSYMERSAYVAGIVQGMLVVVLLMPALWDACNPDRIFTRRIELWAIASCSLLAAVGSDGFLERPMAVSLIPVACAYVYPKFSKYLRPFCGLAAIAILAAACFFFAKTLPGRTTDYSALPHMAGIRTNASEALANENFLQISKAIERVESTGRDVAVVGNNRYPFDYVYHRSPSYNLQMFHYADGPDEMDMLDELMPRYDDVIVVRYWSDAPIYVNTHRKLYAHGYQPTDSAEHYTLFQRETILPIPDAH